MEGFRLAFRVAAVMSIGTLILGLTLRATKADPTEAEDTAQMKTA